MIKRLFQWHSNRKSAKLKALKEVNESLDRISIELKAATALGCQHAYRALPKSNPFEGGSIREMLYNIAYDTSIKNK